MSPLTHVVPQRLEASEPVPSAGDLSSELVPMPAVVEVRNPPHDDLIVTESIDAWSEGIAASGLRYTHPSNGGSRGKTVGNTLHSVEPQGPSIWGTDAMMVASIDV